ncbi:hypothetical protein, partial [Enterococcus casseliflavus]|uniref:hypothetical protein n=1 Tax=Enterococcus casseliflavus TaxID=37734 RepID=UPI003D1161D4
MKSGSCWKKDERRKDDPMARKAKPVEPPTAYRPDVLGTRAALIRAVCSIDDALTATQSAELTWDLRSVKRRLQDLLAKVAA